MRIATSCCLLLIVQGITAQVWQQAMPNTSPSPRVDLAMTFDSARSEVVLFGGLSNGVTPKNDTWVWDGTDWTQRFPSASPPARSNHDMAFDPVRGFVVMFGGDNMQDTWEWDGANWILRGSQNISAAGGARLWWDEHRGHVMLVNRGLDTYEWDGSTWTLINAGPTGTWFGFGATFDPILNQAVVHGIQSTSSSSTTAQISWVWVNSSWTMIPSAGPPRTNTALVHDSVRDRTLMVAGLQVGGGFNPPTNSVWSWSGGSWIEETTSGSTPLARHRHAVAFDSGRGRVVMFGGVNSLLGQSPTDTWEYFSVPATWNTIGAGCPGSGGTPTLAPNGGDISAYIGDSILFDLTGIPTTPLFAPFGLIGISDQVWSGIPLPAQLDALGAPGCSIFISGDASVALTNQGGFAQWSVPLPFDFGLVGQEYFVQGLVVDPLANPLSLTSSNGLSLTIGVR